jgi:hypothetical protein
LSKYRRMSESVQHDEQGSSLHDRWCLHYDEQCSSLHAEGLISTFRCVRSIAKISFIMSVWPHQTNFHEAVYLGIVWNKQRPCEVLTVIPLIITLPASCALGDFLLCVQKSQPLNTFLSQLTLAYMLTTCHLIFTFKCVCSIAKISFIMSVSPHGTTLLPLDWFLWTFIF